MWNKNFRILWFKLQMGKNKHFYFSFPIPLYIFQELLDCNLDLLKFVCLFIPRRPNCNSSPSFTVYTVKELVQTILDLFDSLTEFESYELVDITTTKARISIKIR